uniref:hypothetical protein n=1 Tax=Aeromonas media TaxID=651 RepID=UPI003D1E6067
MKGWFLIMSLLFPCVGYSSTEPFSLADICKAALSTYYGRPLEIMEPEQSEDDFAREGANKRGNSSRLTQSFHFFMFEPI